MTPHVHSRSANCPLLLVAGEAVNKIQVTIKKQHYDKDGWLVFHGMNSFSS